MPELRRREYATRAELQSIADQRTDGTAYLRLAETLTAFLAGLRSSDETLDIIERQRVVRLLVKEILVSNDRIVIRHSIPLPTGPSGNRAPSPIGGYSSSASGKSSPLLANIYLHYVFDLWAERWRRHHAQGNVILVRYADDLVAGFEHQADAERFQAELRDRLARFALTLHPDKTRRILRPPPRRAPASGRPSQ